MNVQQFAVRSYGAVEIAAIGRNRQKVFPQFPFLIITFDRFRQASVRGRFVSCFELRVGQIRPRLEIIVFLTFLVEHSKYCRIPKVTHLRKDFAAPL